jgi:hypothetical protein
VLRDRQLAEIDLVAEPRVRKETRVLGRHLARAEDGGMIDIVLWRDHASAQAAAGAFMAEPSLEPFGAAMTEESVVMRHYAALPPAG